MPRAAGAGQSLRSHDVEAQLNTVGFGSRNRNQASASTK
jgi:hypothetical protein